MKKLSPFLLLFILFASYQWLVSFKKSIIPSHLLANNITPELMILSFVVMFGAQIFMLFAFYKIRSVQFFKISIFCTIAIFASVYALYHPIQLLIMGIFSGAALHLFFLPYNIAYFTYSPKGKTAQRSGLMFSIPPLIGIIAPVLAGYLAEISMSYILVGSLIFALIPFFVLRSISSFSFTYDLGVSWKHIRGFHVPLITEGIWEALIIAIIPVLSLYFFPRPSSYGLYLSYLSIVSISANLLLGHVSDKIGKRRTLLLPIAAILLVFTLLIPWGMSSITRYVLVTSVIQFLLPMFWNITTALFVDRYPNLKLSIPGRELGLALGRFLGIGLTYVLFVMNIHYIILFPILSVTIGIFILSLIFLRK